MFRFTHLRRMVRARTVQFTLLLAMAVPSGMASAQESRPAPVTVASHPEVLGAERLFSAWMEGQLAYRGLPGVAVGVVRDKVSHNI